jgi:hypothetical protein
MLNQTKIVKRNELECWEWIGFKGRDGYGIVHTKGKLIKAHRIAYCNANDKTLADIKDVVVRHTCDNRACVNPLHLLLGTSADNTQDRHERDRDARGSINGNSKLTEEQVLAIRAKYIPWNRANGRGALAKTYGVSSSLISQIVNRDIWTHI